MRVNDTVDIALNKTHLQGNLVIPNQVKGIVIFSHGSGSSRFSPRNQQVANYLHHHFFG